MGNTTSLLSDYGVLSLTIWDHLLDYFVAGNTLDSRGHYMVGAIAQIVQTVAEFLATLSTLLT